MITKTKGPGDIAGIYPAVHQPGAQTRARNAPQTTGQFDQVQISGRGSQENRFQKELTSRLVSEVRTANTTSKVQRIKQEVASGQYKPDAREIAARLLLEGTLYE